MTDEIFMKRAIALAKRGAGRVSPNPLVGAVFVKDGRIIAEGFHRRYGGPHAEIDALGKAGEPIEGTTLYVNLEPCCHQGKTPPCVEAIIAHRPARVVAGTLDPNPAVSGRGMELIARQGIATRVGVLEEECRRLNEVFFKYMETGIPFITLKYAQTLDGRIATASGHSRWISSPASLKFAHRLRGLHDGILVGIGTVVKDDPELTVRLVKGRNPLRIVADSHLAISPDARILQNQGVAPTIIVTTALADPVKRAELVSRGLEILSLGENTPAGVDLPKLLTALGKRGVSSLLVEGGAKMITSFLATGLADRMVIVQAPKIIGAGVEAVGNLGVNLMDEAIRLRSIRTRRLGGDLIMDGRICKNSEPR
ncbi:MAG: bifunctional diaminohydroxyphosphoribosylaminopyrimidine deaminase/5-amino-6-(5-phosphoribosylamino)uracil reductase RibD [Smithellaceae bacterium]|nr:bifunctional diaminohydroxyphosphoribosylaminopyrimidine deaminase/5-amino-6-(5-phosphoribosylamino)uracil reductase RibD [Smithellaceae bacterium]